MSLDYSNASLSFKVRKGLRYVRLYGPRRTLVKARALSHLQQSGPLAGDPWINPACTTPNDPARCMALIGCGNFSYTNIAYYMRKYSPDFLRTALDPNFARAVSLCKVYHGYMATTRLSDILEDSSIKLVYIASNHASHAEYAIELIQAGKHVHIEKPHVVTADQLDRLLDAMRARPDVQVYLGFNRTRSPHFLWLEERIRHESGPTMVNWFVAGHEIPGDHWYFQPEEGGRILGNMCHWTDLSLRIVGLENASPCTIVPASAPEAKSDFSVSVVFADRSIAAITFSAKGYTFEGVREVLNLHKGNVLARLRDFEETVVETGAKRERLRTWTRDHGHRRTILNSARICSEPGARGETRAWIEATARLFLGVREAIESGTPLELHLDGPPAASSVRP